MKLGALIAIAVVASALLPSPTTVAKFKPWKDADESVRVVFWLSVGAGVLIVISLLARSNS